MRSVSVKILSIAFLLAVATLLLPSGMVAHAASYEGWSIVRDSLVADTVAVADSLSKDEPKKDAIDAPVFYECTDSMVWSRTGNAYL